MSQQAEHGTGETELPIGLPAATGEQTTRGHERQMRHRVLRVRIVDVETERLKVGLTLPAGLVGVATRLGARLVPPVPHAASMLQAVERGELSEPMVIDDERNGERVEISLEGSPGRKDNNDPNDL